MANGAQFSADVSVLVAKYKRRQDAIVRQTVQEVANRIVADTPVDTAFARASWWTAINGSPADHPSPPQQVPSGSSVAGAPSLDPVHLAEAVGNVFRLSNAARYIVKLEFGHSAKAPAGMVRVNVAKAPSIVENYARTLGAM